MLNISSQTDSQSMCDIRTVEAFEDSISQTNSNKTEEVPRLILRISNGEKYIATINRINVMLKDLLAEPATFCSTNKTACKKILRIISDESKWAIRNPISSQDFPSHLKSKLISAAGNALQNTICRSFCQLNIAASTKTVVLSTSNQYHFQHFTENTSMKVDVD